MGTVFQVGWARLEPWPGGLDLLRENGFTVAGLALTPDAVALDEFAARAPQRLALVLGTEGDGLTARALRHVDRAVRIPMAGGVDSLNVAAAAAVALWALRAAGGQQGTPRPGTT
jgi:tRNA G18 (ribose-2'-O)-methylase SpoU